MIKIQHYQKENETSWLHCRVLSFLNTQYFDDVYQKKASYLNPSIELVAIKDDIVIGLIDVELEQNAGDFCSSPDHKTGMIWHIAVHPKYQRQQIGEKLLKAAENEALKHGIHYLEAWTREDEFVRNWYFKNEFIKFNSYYHITFSGEKVTTRDLMKDINIQNSFAHYYGKDIETIRSQLTKCYECVGLLKRIFVN